MIVNDSFNYHSLSLTIVFAIKRSMIVHDSLSTSRNVLASLPRIFFDTEVIPSLTLNFKGVLFPVTSRLWLSSQKCSTNMAGPLTRLLGCLSNYYSTSRCLFFSLFFAFLTFSLSASLSSEYSSKLLLCCSSQDDGNALAILHWACFSYPRWPKKYLALSSARSNGKNYHELSCRIWTCPNCMIVGDNLW